MFNKEMKRNVKTADYQSLAAKLWYFHAAYNRNLEDSKSKKGGWEEVE